MVGRTRRKYSSSVLVCARLCCFIRPDTRGISSLAPRPPSARRAGDLSFFDLIQSSLIIIHLESSSSCRHLTVRRFAVLSVAHLKKTLTVLLPLFTSLYIIYLIMRNVLTVLLFYSIINSALLFRRQTPLLVDSYTPPNLSDKVAIVTGGSRGTVRRPHYNSQYCSR